MFINNSPDGLLVVDLGGTVGTKTLSDPVQSLVKTQWHSDRHFNRIKNAFVKPCRVKQKTHNARSA